MNKPIFCYILDDNFPWIPRYVDTEPTRSKVARLKQVIQERHIRDTFTIAEDLAFKVASALGRFLTTRKISDELKKIPIAPGSLSYLGLDQVARRAVRVAEIVRGAKLLLVNDNPLEMRIPIRILEELGLTMDIANSTEVALSKLEGGRYHVVVSDMRRGAELDAGIKLLDQIRDKHISVPVIFTVGQFDPGRGTPPFAFGITNRVDELMNLVFDALERSRG